MKNFINVRIKAYNHYKEKNDIKHNIGTNHKQSKITNEPDSFYNYQKTDPLTTLREWRKEHNHLYKKRRKQNLQINQATLLNGVITFSEAIHKDLGSKYTKEQWEQANIKAVEEIAKYLDTEISYITFHYGELTPHCHYHLKNFDKNAYSISYKYRTKKELSKLQDIAFKHLGKLGMQRGLKKEITNKTHQTTQQYYKKQIKQLRKETRGEVKKLKSIREELKAMENLETTQKKELYNEISKLQKEFRRLQEETDLEKIKAERDQLMEYVKQLEAHLEEITEEEQQEENLEEQIKSKTLEMAMPVPGSKHLQKVI